MSSVAAVMCGVAAISACTGDTPSTTVERHDSAGVSVVVSRAAAWGEASPWSIDSVPQLAVTDGGGGQAYEFSNVADVTRLSDGRLVVLDGDTHQVRFFDPDGTFELAVGREGEGPGDFSRAQDVFAFRGDSVAVYDYWLRRVTILDAHGDLGRVISFPKEMQAQHVLPLGADGLLALAWSLGDFAQISGDYRTSYDVVHLSLDGAVEDTIAVIPAWNGHKEGVGSRYIDYGTIFPVQGVAAANADAVVMGGGESMAFARYSVGGEIQELVRAPVLDEPLSDEEVQAERAAVVGKSTNATFRRLVASYTPPPLRPAYHDLQLDPDGNVWAARYHSPRRQRDDPTTWHVFDTGGAWLGDMVTPARFQVFEIGRDYILGVRRDTLDVEDVEVLGLHRGGRP